MTDIFYTVQSYEWTHNSIAEAKEWKRKQLEVWEARATPHDIERFKRLKIFKHIVTEVGL